MLKSSHLFYLLLATSSAALLPMIASAQDATKMHRSEVSELTKPSPTYPEPARANANTNLGSEHHKPTSKYYDTVNGSDNLPGGDVIKRHSDATSSYWNSFGQGHHTPSSKVYDLASKPSAHRLDISELNAPEPPMTVQGSSAGQVIVQNPSVSGHSDYDSRAMGNGYGHPTATQSAVGNTLAGKPALVNSHNSKTTEGGSGIIIAILASQNKGDKPSIPANHDGGPSHYVPINQIAGGAIIVDKPMPRGHDRRWSYAFETGHDGPTSATVTLITAPEDISKPAGMAHRTDITTVLVHQDATSLWDGDKDAKISHKMNDSTYVEHHRQATSLHGNVVKKRLGKVLPGAKKLRSVKE